jgi:anthraniloyl-CoA monooxygenase
VVERNQADDTFGFGVGLLRRHARCVQAADEPSYRAITRSFAYWDDIEIHFKGSAHRIGGNGFCGCSRRTLLMLLHERARALGVEVEFRREAQPEDFPDADLVVAADGINSPIRERFRDHFAPEVDLRPNRFAWMGSTRPFDAFTFFFKECPEGIFIAHCYQYERGASTWVLETDPETFARAGLEDMGERERPLHGGRLRRGDAGATAWYQPLALAAHPDDPLRRWPRGNLVLLGDAKASAHFSIGSGTKLAMEDAIALHAAFRAGGDVAACLHRFEPRRAGRRKRRQHAADVSLVWSSM